MTRSVPQSFRGSEGRQLAAVFDQPDGEPLAYALYAHCFTCTKDLKGAHWFGQQLAERGIAMLRFDFAGLGGSEGDFSDTDLMSNVEDLRAAADFMSKEYQAPQLLVGHSLGGAAVLEAARRMPSVAAVATIAAPFRPSHIRRHLLPPEVDQPPERFEVRIGGRTFRLRRRLVESLEALKVPEVLNELSRPLLVLHSPQDQVVAIGEGERLFAAAHQPKSFVALTGADHLLSKRPDAQHAAQLVWTWFSRYLDGIRKDA